MQFVSSYVVCMNMSMYVLPYFDKQNRLHTLETVFFFFIIDHAILCAWLTLKYAAFQLMHVPINPI